MSETQMYHELIGVMSQNPFTRHNSSARLQMYFSHLTQALATSGLTPRNFLTGTEINFGENTHSVRFPCKADIFRVIEKEIIDPETGRRSPSPMSVIIYQNLDSHHREFDVLEVPRHHCLHQHYGYSFKPTADVNRVKIGAVVPEGTIIANSPGVLADGTFMYGTEVPFALMSHPAVTEDGVLVAKEFLDSQRVEAFGNRTFRIGGDRMPLNVYGDKHRYRFIPDIGEKIRPDGLLFAAREFDPILSAIYMHPDYLQMVENGDDPVYAVPGAVITDITVIRGLHPQCNYPEEFNAQCEYYHSKHATFCRQMLDVEKEIRARYGNNSRFGPALQAMLTSSLAYSSQGSRRNQVEPIYDKLPVRDWLIKVDFKYMVRPTIGYKVADEQGGKAVIVAILPLAHMPRDASGLSAMAIQDPNSPVNRNNTGSSIGMYINAASRMVALRMKEMLKEDSSQLGYQTAWEYLYGYYACLSEPMLKLLNDPRFDIREHIQEVLRRESAIPYLPPDNPVSYYEVILNKLMHDYPATYGPVTYIGYSGRQVTTKAPVLIGCRYTLMLEKDGRSWSSVASSRLHGALGVPAKPGPSDKYSLPGKESPIKLLAEAELRLINAACGGEVGAQLMEMSNNPLAHKSECESIFRAVKPTHIQNAVDWSVVPMTGGRVVEYLKSMYYCLGIEFTLGGK